MRRIFLTASSLKDSPDPLSMTRKAKIPMRLREQVWTTHCGETYRHKCAVSWCTTRVTVFDFECGHNVPESSGGATDLDNLRPICSKCNKSMGSTFTIDEFSRISNPATNEFACFRFRCLKS